MLSVFEGLLPGIHNDIVLDILFDLATWHTYVKLHLHMDRTLEFFKMAMAYLGKSVHKFQQTTCLLQSTIEVAGIPVFFSKPLTLRT